MGSHHSNTAHLWTRTWVAVGVMPGENPVGDTRDLIPCRAGILGFRILP